MVPPVVAPAVRYARADQPELPDQISPFYWQALMPIHRTLLPFILALATAATLFGLAPAAAGQDLAPMVGDPVAFHVSLPDGWAREQDDGMMYVTNADEDFAILVGALDIVAAQEDPLPIPEAEARRLFTTMIMGSDSLLLNLFEAGFLSQTEFPVTDLQQGLGSLGGERAAHLSARFQLEGEEGWFRFHVTMKDGVLYMLGFMGKGDFDAGREPLMGRIHESFVLAAVPPPLGVRAGREVRPIKSRN